MLVVTFLASRVLRSVYAHRLSCGAAFCAYGALYDALRLALDPLRADGRPERFLGLSIQQGIALALMLGGAAGWQWLRRPRVTGLVTAV